MKKFYLYRKEDESGISGTGFVAEGVQFSNGKCVISWTTKYSSIAIYDSIAELENIHGHNGKTTVKWAHVMAGTQDPNVTIFETLEDKPPK